MSQSVTPSIVAFEPERSIGAPGRPVTALRGIRVVMRSDVTNPFQSAGGWRKESISGSIMFDQFRATVEKMESDIANGPIVPAVTPEQIRHHLGRYDLQNR